MSECVHTEYRWLDCADCEDKGITCELQVCVDCGERITNE